MPTDEVVFPSAKGEVTQPRTGATMKVHLLLTGDVDVPAGSDRREVFADWLVAPENPFFSRSLVMRPGILNMPSAMKMERARVNGRASMPKPPVCCCSPSMC